jgi:hypothetical protein
MLLLQRFPGDLAKQIEGYVGVKFENLQSGKSYEFPTSDKVIKNAVSLAPGQDDWYAELDVPATEKRPTFTVLGNTGDNVNINSDQTGKTYSIFPQQFVSTTVFEETRPKKAAQPSRPPPKNKREALRRKREDEDTELALKQMGLARSNTRRRSSKRRSTRKLKSRSRR